MTTWSEYPWWYHTQRQIKGKAFISKMEKSCEKPSAFSKENVLGFFATDFSQITYI